jgi:dihydrolipoamide dehydrogenase
VTVLEIMPGVLPGSDRESALRLERILKKQGLKVFTHMKIEEARAGEGGVVCKGTCLRTRTPFEYGAEKALLAAGRKPNVAGLFDGPPAVELGSGGFIKVDHRMETSVRGIYAIGDVVGGKLLAHKAYHDAVVAVENASGLDRSVDYDALPSAVFTDPEFATVGLTQEEAAERGVKVRTGVFPLQASGRALTMDSTDGMIKIVADESGRVIGAHLLAPGASDMIPVLTVAIAKRMTVEEIGSTIYVHPSLSEAIGEAALKVNNEALHLLNI